MMIPLLYDFTQTVRSTALGHSLMTACILLRKRTDPMHVLRGESCRVVLEISW